MKIMLRAALAVLSISSIGPAFADGGDGPVANTQFTEVPGVVAEAAVQNAPVATAQNGQATKIYVTREARGTWLFSADQNGGANS